MMPKMLEVSNLKKYFRVGGKSWLHAVDDINFTLDEGKTIGVVGESGCGKTTLGRTILHLIKPTSGKILFSGDDISSPSIKQLKKARERMQIIFQDPYSSLNPRMTVSETIMEPLIIQGRMSRAKIREETKIMMDTVGLAARFENSYPHELDGGRRQRIGVARALILKPKFIVCDEPVSALDVSIQAQIINLMLDLQDEFGLSYMFVTHDLSVVKYISNDIMVMYLGQMVEKAPSDDLFKNPMHPYTKALLSAIPIPDIHSIQEQIIMEGEITSPIDPRPGCRFTDRCRYASDECVQPQVLEESSEDHFVACCKHNSI